MDIWLIGTGDSIQIRPASIHGMLWLQTHFEDATGMRLLQAKSDFLNWTRKPFPRMQRTQE